MAAWLDSHNDPDATWELVVPNSQSGSRLIAQYGISVMSLGGFLGQDPTISVRGFADLVASGEVRYVLVTGGGIGGGFPGGQFQRGGTRGGPAFGFGGTVAPNGDAVGSSAVLSAVRIACAQVTDPSLPSQYRGSMYDCAGAAGRLTGNTPRQAPVFSS